MTEPFDMDAALTTLAAEQDLIRSGVLQTTQVTYPATAYCQGCAWWGDGADRRDLPRISRHHTQQTGHEVRIEHSRETVYRLVPGGVQGAIA